MGYSEIFAVKSGVCLDLGCGENKQPGSIGVDSRSLPGVDIVQDLMEMPWNKIPPNCANSIILSHVFEHIIPWKVFDFMEEVWETCKADAKVFISGPYAMGFRYIQDPTHCNPINDATFFYWDPSHALYEVYRPSPFKLESFEIYPVGNDRDFNAVLTRIS